MSTNNAYIAILLCTVAVLVVCLLFFLSGLGNVSYLVFNGISHSLSYTDPLRFEFNLLGILYVLTLILAALLLMVFFLLGGSEDNLSGNLSPVAARAADVRRAPTLPSREADVPAAPPLPQPIAETRGTHSASAAAGTAASQVGAASDAHPSAETPQVLLPRRQRHVSENDDDTQGDELDLPTLENFQARYDVEDDDDVVYGSGRITEDALWDFVQNHPDSAIKFLFRKNLDNKPLPPIEEDIYRNWERRGMRRIHIRNIILKIMDWQKLPDDFPHNVWRLLRNKLHELEKSPVTAQHLIRENLGL